MFLNTLPSIVGKRCPSLLIPDSDTPSINALTYEFEDVVNIACLPGYRIVGQGPYDRLFQITCNASALWENVETCTRKILLLILFIYYSVPLNFKMFFFFTNSPLPPQYQVADYQIIQCYFFSKSDLVYNTTW